MPLSDRLVAVVIPAYNEADSLPAVIAGVPDFVSLIIVVDDGSTDDTVRVLAGLAQPRLIVIGHAHNRGVGAAIASGYGEALRRSASVVAVMGGDGQMDPRDLTALVTPVLEGRTDYAKGDRFLGGEAFRVMPLVRYVGNVSLSLISKPVTGYWRVFDSQCGYTAISREALAALPLDELYPRYGVPNDILTALHERGFRVLDVPVRPLYPARHSHMRLLRVVTSLSWLLVRLWRRRLRNEWGKPRPIASEVNDVCRN